MAIESTPTNHRNVPNPFRYFLLRKSLFEKKFDPRVDLDLSSLNGTFRPLSNDFSRKNSTSRVTLKNVVTTVSPYKNNVLRIVMVFIIFMIMYKRIVTTCVRKSFRTYKIIRLPGTIVKKTNKAHVLFLYYFAVW